MDNGKIYNIVLPNCGQEPKEELKILDKWRQTKKRPGFNGPPDIDQGLDTWLETEAVWDIGNRGVQV